MTTNVVPLQYKKVSFRTSLYQVCFIGFGIIALPNFPHIDQQKEPQVTHNFSGSAAKSTPMKKIETPKELKTYSTQRISIEMKKKKNISFDSQDISVLSYTGDFLLPDYMVFVGSKMAPPSFANDRGYMDNNSIYHRGVWSKSGKLEVKEKQYGEIFSRFELSKEEAISFWSHLVGISNYVSKDVEGIFEGGGASAPTWEQNVLHIYVESHVGMRGPVYDEYKVYFPKNKSDLFKIEKR